jgi:hypothetical protein
VTYEPDGSQAIRPQTGPIKIAIAVGLGALFGFLIFKQMLGPSPADNLTPGSLDDRGFRFMSVEAGTGEPVRYDACEPIHYVINPSLAPIDGVADVHKAIEVMGEVTGLKFIYDGETDEVFTHDRQPYQRDRYGDRWAPILIGWSAEPLQIEGTASAAPGQPIGVGGSIAFMNGAGHPVFVSGVAQFDPNQKLASGFGGETWGQVMLHELGHVVGLDHVADPNALMNDFLRLRPATWTIGERAGLWELGIGNTCLAQPPLP